MKPHIYIYIIYYIKLIWFQVMTENFWIQHKNYQHHSELLVDQGIFIIIHIH